MGFLKSSGFREVLSGTRILPEKHLAVFFKPVQDLTDILLEEAQREPLMELQLLLMPGALQRAVLRQDFVNHTKNMLRTFGIVSLPFTLSTVFPVFWNTERERDETKSNFVLESFGSPYKNSNNLE